MNFAKWPLFEKVWLISFTLIGAWLCQRWGDTAFGYSVMLSGIICVVLVARGSIWNYPIGIYNTSAYSWLAWQNGFYGELALNAVYYNVMQIWGWWAWKDKIEAGVVKPQKMTPIQITQWGIIVAEATLIFGYILAQLPGQNTPWMDSASTVFAVIAMYLMVKRYREQWLLWISLDVVNIVMWSLRLSSGVEGAMSMTVMWSAFLINAVYGYYKWSKYATVESVN